MTTPSTEEIFAAPIEDILALTIAANSIASLGNNPYEIRNALILEKKKQKVRYKNGYTFAAPATPPLEDAMPKAPRSSIISSNMMRADKNMIRAMEMDTHHVVAPSNLRGRIWLLQGQRTSQQA